MTAIQFEVFGVPGPQGSKRHVGGGRMIESSKKVAPWREAVKWAALEAMRKAGIEKFTGPVRLLIVFTLPRPKSASKRKALWPAARPDLSKLVRSTEDAITDAGVWADDGRVVSMVVDKTYPTDPDLSALAEAAIHPNMALSRPGAVVKIIPFGVRA